MEKIFISICIPAYNRADFLGRLLDSIAMQSFRHFEVIITDDSPGNEIELLIGGHSLKPMIMYFKNEKTLGSPENWNEGVRRAKGEWIKMMHDDDWFADSGSLNQFAEALKNGNASFYFSAYTNIFPDNRSKQIFLSPTWYKRLKIMPDFLLAANHIGPPSITIFRNDPEIFFDNRLKWLVDIDFYIRYLKKYPPPVYIPNNLVFIGISESQITNQSFGNPGVEIPERWMVFDKMGIQSLRKIPLYDSWWRFIRNFKIKEVKQIAMARDIKFVPASIRSMISFQNKIPDQILNTGFFSKPLMFVHYVFSLIKGHLSLEMGDRNNAR